MNATTIKLLRAIINYNNAVKAQVNTINELNARCDAYFKKHIQPKDFGANVVSQTTPTMDYK